MSISLLNTTLNPTSSVYSQINSNFQFLQSGLNGFIPVSSGNSFVKTAGNQTISGVKNFTSRPTVNGVGVVLQNEVTSGGTVNTSTFVQTVGDQTIGGKKTFTSGIAADVDIPGGKNLTFFDQYGGYFEMGRTSGSYSDAVFYLKNSSTNATILKISPELNPAHIEFPSLPFGQKQKMSIGNGIDKSTVTILELNSTTQGFLPPRLTTSQRNALRDFTNSGSFTPILPAGLTIYNTTSKTIEVYDGVAWNSLSKDSSNDGFSLIKVALQVPKRKTFSVVTPSLAPGASASIDMPLGAFRGYFLYQITASHPSWTVLYKNSFDRTNDALRTQNTPPSSNAGVIAQAINLTDSSTISFTPAALGWVDYTTYSGPARSYNLPIKVRNNSTAARPISVFITLVPTDADENII